MDKMGTKSATEQIIEIVKAYPVLYDHSHPDYWKFSKKSAIWEGIGKIFDEDSSHIKKLWGNIKRSYNRHLQAVRKPQPNSVHFGWPYAKHMEFYNFFPQNREYPDTEDDGTDNDSSRAELDASEMYSSQDEGMEDELFNTRRSTRIKKRKELGKIISYSEATEKGFNNDVYDMYFDEEVSPSKRPKRNSYEAKKTTTPKKTPNNIKGMAKLPQRTVAPNNDEMPHLTPVDHEDEHQAAPTNNTISSDDTSCNKCSMGINDFAEIYDNRKNLTSMELIFLSYAKTLETFTPERRVLAKMKIADVIMKEELLGVQKAS